MTENEKQEEQGKIELKRLVGVQFSAAGKVHSFSAADHELAIHDLVIVEGDKGPIVGRIIIPPYEKSAKEVATNIRTVLRKAKPEDIERHECNREEAMKAFNMCQKKIVDHDLSMKLVDVDILKGDGKAIFYFTAEERVDFRSLVKDLATALHMRIEMRQIGARDAAKSIGALGSCGLTCCCETHLREFKSISIQMAKNQGLSPNPAKLTGMCGKLKCCMLYENEMYTQFKKKLPCQGSRITTERSCGFVTGLDVPRQIVYARMENSDKEEKLTPSEIKSVEKRSKTRPRKDESDQKRGGRQGKRETKRRDDSKGKQQDKRDNKRQGKRQNSQQRDSKQRNTQGNKRTQGNRNQNQKNQKSGNR